MLNFKKQCSPGFTLLELMIAVAIVFVLATLSMVSYSKYLERADIAIATSDIVQIEGIVDRYYVRQGNSRRTVQRLV